MTCANAVTVSLNIEYREAIHIVGGTEGLPQR
jgi:hypothetical protein